MSRLRSLLEDPAVAAKALPLMEAECKRLGLVPRWSHYRYEMCPECGTQRGKLKPAGKVQNAHPCGGRTECFLYTLISELVGDGLDGVYGMARCIRTDNFCKVVGRAMSLDDALEIWQRRRIATIVNKFGAGRSAEEVLAKIEKCIPTPQPIKRG